MKIPLISKIPIKYAVAFATAVFFVQILEQTDATFASLCWLYTLISCLAFNLCGGLIYPSGWFVFSNAMLTSIFGVTYKLLLFEPGESHLLAPNYTLFAYCLGMTMIVLVAQLNRRIVPKQPVLGTMKADDMKKAAAGAFFLGLAFQLFTYTGQEVGSVVSLLRQINNFLPIALILGTFYQVKRSDGRQSSNWVVWVSGLTMFSLGGILGTSKQGLASGGVAWFITAIAAGHSFTRKQIIGILVMAFIFQAYLVPYSQVARNTRTEDSSIADDLKNAAIYLSDLRGVRQTFLAEESAVDYNSTVTRPHLYDQPQGIVDRLTMLAPDDLLVSYTNEGNYEGISPTIGAFVNLVPHFIWRNKPTYSLGNHYGREVGMISDADEGTGISFSPVADAYHQMGFEGVILLTPVFIFIEFLVMDSLAGDVRKSPWGLLFALTCTHVAPEGLLAGQLGVATFTAFSIVVVSLMAKYILPLIAGVVTNQERTRVIRTTDFKATIRPKDFAPAPFDSQGDAPA